MDYSDLSIEDTWVGYLRTRLPYSFSEIHKQGETQYILSGPLLSTHFAEHHNFWKRGYVYYAVGKLIDICGLSVYWQEYRILHTDQLRNEHSGSVDHFSKQPRDVFNALQLEKLWAVVTDDHLDRERAVMTNVTQAIEFLSKGHPDSRSIPSDKGILHSLRAMISKRYTSRCRRRLQLEMQTESVAFAEKYRGLSADHRR